MFSLWCLRRALTRRVFASALLALGLGAFARAEENPPTTTIIYKEVAGQSLHLYVEKPADWKATDHRVAFVFIHGGGWLRRPVKPDNNQTRYFAQRGMVGISIEYRLLSPDNHEPPAICCTDAKSAMRYVRAHAKELGIDPARIIASGGSAGGHLAAFCALVDGQDDPADDLTISPRPQALVLFNPVLDNGPKTEGGWNNERVGDRVKEFSPAHNVRRNNVVPTIMFLGRADTLIPVATLERFQKRMRDAGTTCELFLYDQQGHGFFNQEPYLTQTLHEADTFLTKLGYLTAPAQQHLPR